MFEHPDNKLCAALLDVQPATTLSADEELKLTALIESSIVARYCGDLGRQEDLMGKSGPTYTPLDTDAVRELLTTLWGELVSAQTIEQVYTTLVEDGAEKWPRAYCEEDDDAAREQRLKYLDYEIECAEEHPKLISEERLAD